MGPVHKACIFCQLAGGQIPADLEYEDDHLVAFLDIRPIREGHVQIIPRLHVETFDAVPATLAANIVWLGQRIAKAQKKIYNVDRVAFLFTGGDVAHVHAHVLPMIEKTDITSRRYIAEETVTFHPLPKETPERRASVAAKLRATLDEA